jgi:uncharacterized protein (TIGR02246 family)
MPCPASACLRPGRLVFLLVLLAAPALNAQTRPRQPAVPPVEPFVSRYFAAWSDGDLEKIEALYATDAKSAFFDLASLKRTGWAEHRAGIRSFREQFTDLTLSPQDDLTVSRQGNMAWTAVTFQASGTPDEGEPLEFEGRHTAVWVRTGSEWRIVHEHVSVPWYTGMEEEGAPEAPHDPDEAPVRELFARYEERWNRGDAEGLAQLWAEEGDIVNLQTASATAGQVDVARMWSRAMTRRPANFTGRLRVAVSVVRFFGPDVALVDGTFEYWTGQTARAPGQLSARERYTVILRREEEAWRIAAARVVGVPLK